MKKQRFKVILKYEVVVTAEDPNVALNLAQQRIRTRRKLGNAAVHMATAWQVRKVKP